MSQYIYAIHGENDLDYDGWVICTEGIGYDPNHHNGADYRGLQHTPIVRLNVGYPPTIPEPQHYEDFAQRCANFVAASAGCSRWIVGNEMNHAQERPNGKPITPQDYARCYDLVHDAIHAQPGHEWDEVLIGAVAPWNNQTTYPGNEAGDWIVYFQDIQRNVRRLDGITLHTYLSSQERSAVSPATPMGPPFEHRIYGFQAYTEFMEAILPKYRGLPVYITECNVIGAAWKDEQTGVVQLAYQDIAEWNLMHPDRLIRCLALYRWQYDIWTFRDKPGVIADFMDAVSCGYTWIPPEPPTPEPPVPPKPEQWTFRVRVEGTSSEGRVRTWEGELREL